MDKNCCQTTAKIKNQKPYRSHPILNVVSKDPKGPKITDKMKPTTMDEHMGKKGSVL